MFRVALSLILVLVYATGAIARCGNPYCVMCYGYSARNYQSYWTVPVKRLVIESTPQIVVDKMLELAELTPDDVLYDLGCGDGRFLKTASEKYGCRSVGIEIDSEVLDIAKRNLRGVSGVRVVSGDARQYILDGATVVVMYLDTKLMKELVHKLSKARMILSYSHPVPGYLNETIMVDGKYPVYVTRPEFRLPME